MIVWFGNIVFQQRVAQFDFAVAFALNEKVGRRDGIGSRVVILAVDFDDRFGVVFANPVLGFGQHPAGSAGWVANRGDDALAGQNVLVGFQQHVDHQPDHFAWREVVPSGFVGGFVKSPDQVLEQQPHRDVVDLLGTQVDVNELGNDQVQPIRLG